MKEKKDKLTYIIISHKERYKSTNKRISSLFNDYNKYITNYEDEINNHQNKNKSFIPAVNIKNLIENQQLLIKELVHIINNLLLNFKTNLNKASSNKKNSIQKIIKNNNKNINYLKNNSKVNDENNSYYINSMPNKNIINNRYNNHDNTSFINNEKKNKLNIESKNKFNLDLSFLNIKAPYKNRTKINQYINKQEKRNSCNKNDISKSSISSNIFSTKNKSYINISHSFISINDINKNNNNSSLINGISSYKNKNLKKDNSSKKYHSSDKNLFFNTTSFFTNINSINKNKRNNSNLILNNNCNYINNNINIKNNKTSYQNTDYSSNKMVIPYSTFNDSISEDIFIINKEKYKNIYDIINDKKINNLKNYEIGHQYHITPNRMVKEMYNISYSKLNKYEQRRNRKSSFRQNSKTVKI